MMAYTAKSMLAYDEVVLRDQCAECWQPVAMPAHSLAEDQRDCEFPALDEVKPLPQTGDLAVQLRNLLDELGTPVIECPPENREDDN